MSAEILVRQNSEPAPHHWVDFLVCPQAEMAQLKERLVRSQGWLELWIHTHYNEQTLVENIRFEDGEKEKRYWQLRERLIQSLLGIQRSPVVAFVPVQPKSRKAIDYQKVYRTSEVKQPVYYVTTWANDPAPFIGIDEAVYEKKYLNIESKKPAELDDDDLAFIADVLEISKANPMDIKKMSEGEWRRFIYFFEQKMNQKLRNKQEIGWDTFFQQCKVFGVKGVIVHGRNYFQNQVSFYKSSVNDDYVVYKQQHQMKNEEIPSGCVGEVCKRVLLQGLKLRITKITYPDQPTRLFQEEIRDD